MLPNQSIHHHFQNLRVHHHPKRRMMMKMLFFGISLVFYVFKLTLILISSSEQNGYQKPTFTQLLLNFSKKPSRHSHWILRLWNNLSKMFVEHSLFGAQKSLSIYQWFINQISLPPSSKNFRFWPHTKKHSTLSWPPKHKGLSVLLLLPQILNTPSSGFPNLLLRRWNFNWIESFKRPITHSNAFH